jgi:zinc transport system ATP-binding protein
MKSADPIIELEDVSFQYDANRKVLSHISLTLFQGDFLALLGPNGSGKSTLIKLILGLLKPHQGEIRLFGEPQNRFKDWSRIGYVSQKANSFNTGFPATVYEVVSSGLFGKMGLFRWLGRKEKSKIIEIIKWVGLEAVLHEPIGQLSGGQQQRVFIARALVSQPDLLILDEPLVGVDAESTNRLLELLVKLNTEQNISLLLVSHDIGAITSKVKQVACLNKTLFFHGETNEFVTHQKEILAHLYGYEVEMIEHSH